MKKRNFLFMMVAFLMMFATSCSNDLDSGMIATGETSLVSFSVETPKIASRAYDNPLKLQYAVYVVAEGEEETEVLQELEGLRVNDAVIEGGSTSIKLNLVAGKTYKVIFWAAGENAPYAVDFENKQVVVSSESAFFNEASADAFFACHEFTVADDQTDAESVTLVRPVAQLNIGTADLDVAADLGYDPEKTTVKVSKIYTTLNLLDGTVDGEKEITFTAKSNTAESSIDFPVAGYDNLAMSYMLVGLDKKVVDIEFTYYLGEMQETRTIGSVPVQRNYKTNIYGSILTKEVDVNVNLEDFWGEENVDTNLPEIAEGVKADVAEVADATIFYVDKAIGLEWIAANVGTTEGFADKKVILTADFDLTGVTTNGDSFAPIGSTGERDDRGRLVCEPFKGTFDGNGKTIKGLYQSGWDMGYEWGQYGSIGLFSELEGATVKNLVIEGMEAQVEGGDISFIAGSATGDCVFENIEIKNSKIGTYNNGIGGIIGWSGAGNYTFKNIKLGSDVVLGGLWGSFDSSIGGIVGQAEPGATYNFEKVEISCRLDAYNDVTASYQYYLYRMCGMLIGRCQKTTNIDGSNYPDLSQYNITCTDVTVNFGDWMNYHYCYGFNGSRYTRVEAGFAYGGLDTAAEGHDEACTDHMLCLPFTAIIGGDQYGVRPITELEGITVNYPASYNPEN